MEIKKQPLFIHVNSSGGRYIRRKLCENIIIISLYII